MQRLELFHKLVAFDSTSSNSNLPIAEFIAGLLNTRGRVELLYSADRRKCNLVATFGTPRGDRNGLILSGHMDCVPALEAGWESDPFRLTDRGERWVGRGASDMKGFLSLAIAAALQVDTKRLTAPLVLIFTYDEEVGTLGARELHDRWDRSRALPRATVIGEPTELRVVRMHKGHLKLRVTLSGQSAHSGYPHLGRNAIELGARVIEALRQLRETLQEETSPNAHLFTSVPFIPLNIGTIRGGAAINVVPDQCVIELGLRPLPGVSSQTLMERVTEAVRGVTATDAVVDMLSDSPPMLLGEDASVLRELSALRGQTSSQSVNFATDAGWMEKMGLECVLFGPGSIEVAHRPNEFMPKSEYSDAAPLLDAMIQRFCRA